jgi:hypothetical protein
VLLFSCTLSRQLSIARSWQASTWEAAGVFVCLFICCEKACREWRDQVGIDAHLHSSVVGLVMYGGDETGGLVVDIGSANARFGWAGEDVPKSVFSSVRLLPREAIAPSFLSTNTG